MNAFARIINFPKRKTADLIKGPSHEVVVMNIVNHWSLMAASLYAMARRALNPSATTTLVDIRDVLPDADMYVWVDADSPASFKDTFGKMMAKATDPTEYRRWFAKLVRCSTIVDNTDMLLFENSVFGQMAARLYENHSREAVYPLVEKYFIKTAMLARAFNNSGCTMAEWVKYSALLSQSYNWYHGGYQTFESVEYILASEKEVDEDIFNDQQQRLSRSLTNKSRVVMFGNQIVHYVTTVGPDVYALIRRLKLSKKHVVHSSEGTYGMVIYSPSLDFLDSGGVETAAVLTAAYPLKKAM